MASLTHLNMKNDIAGIEEFPMAMQSKFEKLGTDIDIRIIVADEIQEISAKSDLLEVCNLYEKFDRIFNRFEKESELSKLNSKLGQYDSTSQCMREIVLQSLAYHKKTNGLFDPRILDVLKKIGYADDFEDGTRKLQNALGKQDIFVDRDLSDDLKIKGGKVFFGAGMDFSGIAKGYITDQIAKFLLKKGWQDFLVDSGGDMFMHGVDEDGKVWTVGVEGIEESKLIFAISDKAIATSGIGKRRWEIEGRRFHHIVNPKKPEHFSFDLKSVTVVAQNTVEADVLAKTIFLMGRDGGILYAKENDIAAVLLDYRGTAWISPKAKEFAH